MNRGLTPSWLSRVRFESGNVFLTRTVYSHRDAPLQTVQNSVEPVFLCLLVPIRPTGTMTFKRISILVVLLPVLGLAGWWLSLGYGTYKNVQRFDVNYGDCRGFCPDIGRPSALWPYSMFIGPDPRRRS